MENLEIGISNFNRHKHQLFFQFYAGNWSFSTTYWYEGVDFFEIEQRFGKPALENIYFHIAAFELNKLGSLAPQKVSAGPFQEYVTTSFEILWRTIFKNVWAQWRYENDLPDYTPPEWEIKQPEKKANPIQHEIGEIELLSFCGGGKDSLLGAKVLEAADLPFTTLGYSHSIYGNANPQHQLIQELILHSNSKKHYRQWIYDDFMDSPILELHPELNIQTLTAAETPSSIFATLPNLLQEGFKYLVLAHEKSADVGNLIWDKTGEEINHQWGKSYEAEQLLNSYIQKHLVQNCQYFSILKPLQDVLIFNAVKTQHAALKNTHSCNIKKPWCCRCPKCAYVLLNYYAYLPKSLVDQIIPEKDLNIFDLPENQLAFKQMIGLGEHTPFECIGQIEESRLAFELCRRKGLKGKAIQYFSDNCPTQDWKSISFDFTELHLKDSGIPDQVLNSVLPVFKTYQKEARSFFETSF